MRRRDLLAGLAGLGVAGAGGAFALGGPGGSDERIEPAELTGIEAPGSDAGTVLAPREGGVTFVKFFATWCGVCRRMMDELPAVHRDLAGEVQFVSVTNEPLGGTTTREDVAAWWAEHGGAWQVAHDADLELTERLDATAVPYTVVLDGDNAVEWAASGYESADELREPIRAALEG